jgi:hypothetical protein
VSGVGDFSTIVFIRTCTGCGVLVQQNPRTPAERTASSFGNRRWHVVRRIRQPEIDVLRLQQAQRRVLVAHLPELANVAAGSLLFGQFLSERPYSLGLAAVGVGAWAVLIGAVFVIAAGERS